MTHPDRTPWYDHAQVDTEQVHERLLPTVEAIRQLTMVKRNCDFLLLNMFSDMRLNGLHGGGLDNVPDFSLDDLRTGKLSENILKRIALTAHAKLTKAKPEPRFRTTGADPKLQSDAEKRDKYLHAGLFHREKLTRKRSMAILHGILTGTGVGKVTNDGRRPVAEIVPPWELLVDPAEAIGDVLGAPPRNMYQVKAVDRGVLMALFPDRADDIKDADVSSHSALLDEHYTVDRYTSDMVPVVYGYHLPTGDIEDAPKKARDAMRGRHAIVMPGVTLHDQEWTRPRHPYALWRYTVPPVGLWGDSLIRDLVGSQLELNRSLWFRQAVMRLLASPWWAVQKGSGIARGRWTNIIGRVIEYVGSPPQLITPSPVSDAVFAHDQATKGGMFESSGISQLSAQSLKPMGLDSGKAIRVFESVEAEGLTPQNEETINWTLDMAELWIDETRELAAELGKGEALDDLYMGDDEVATIAWDEGYDENKMRLHIAPMSALSQSISGLFQDLTDLINMGAIAEGDDVIELLAGRVPDLEAFRKRRLTRRNHAEKIIDVRILAEGRDDIEPEPLWPLELMRQIGADALLRAQASDAPTPDANLEALQVFLRKVDDRIQANAAAQAAAAPVAGPPPGPGAPTPGPAGSEVPPMPGGVPLPGQAA